MIKEIIKRLESSANTLNVGNEKLVLLSNVKYILNEYLGDNDIKKEEYFNMVDVLHQENDNIIDEFVKRFSLDDYTSSTDYENALDYCVKELKKLINKYYELKEKLGGDDPSFRREIMIYQLNQESGELPVNMYRVIEMIDLLRNKYKQQPLKFEEIKPKMWIFDSKEKMYICVTEILKNGHEFMFGLPKLFDDEEEFGYEIFVGEWEDNRFYKYEVNNESIK